MKKTALLLFALLLPATLAFAQMSGGKRPSPPAKAECKFADGKSIHVAYSSPQAKGRKIFGGLVPFGEPWRTGANEATTFVNDVDVTVGGKTIPAGSYTMFTIPAQDKWTLIISKRTGEWGVPYPGERSDFTRADMKLSKLSATQENFTISFDPSGSSCTMRLEWETTRASIQITQKK